MRRLCAYALARYNASVLGRLLRFLVMVAVLVAADGHVDAASPIPAVSVTEAVTRWSSKHLFEVRYSSSPAPVPLLRIHDWTVTIADATGAPVTGAAITVLGGMPAHAHGLPTVPQVKELGGGRYLIEGLKFHMPGAWVVAFRIKAGTRVDSVSFDLQLD